MIESPAKLTDAEVRWVDEAARLFAVIAQGSPRIGTSNNTNELRKLSELFRKAAAEARSIPGPTARTEDVRRPLELACVQFAYAAAQKTRNSQSDALWTRTTREAIAFWNQCSDRARRFTLDVVSAWEE